MNRDQNYSQPLQQLSIMDTSLFLYANPVRRLGASERCLTYELPCNPITASHILSRKNVLIHPALPHASHTMGHHLLMHVTILFYFVFHLIIELQIEDRKNILRKNLLLSVSFA